MLVSLRICLLSLEKQWEPRKAEPWKQNLRLTEFCLLCMLLCGSENASQYASFTLRNLCLLLCLPTRCYSYVALSRLLIVFEHWSSVQTIRGTGCHSVCSVYVKTIYCHSPTYLFTSWFINAFWFFAWRTYKKVNHLILDRSLFWYTVEQSLVICFICKICFCAEQGLVLMIYFLIYCLVSQLKCQTVYLRSEILYGIVKFSTESFALSPWNLE